MCVDALPSGQLMFDSLIYRLEQERQHPTRAASADKFKAQNIRSIMHIRIQDSTCKLGIQVSTECTRLKNTAGERILGCGGIF